MKFKTKLIHGGLESDPLTGAVNVPIYQVSTFKQDTPETNKGYDYSRAGNPTRAALESYITVLEDGTAGYAFASGLAAISAVLMTQRAGSHFIVSDDVYGGTYRLLKQILEPLNLTATFVDATDLQQIEAAIQPNTTAILIETPGNPFLKVVDIEAISKISKKHALLFIVDNTFLTPYYQKPLNLGADVVVHSATKYLGGHSDVLAGLVVVRNRELADRIHLVQKGVGAVLGPQDCFLLLRGMKTLAIRMEEHERNTAAIVEWLVQQPEVETVYYPGLSTHPGHELAKKQATGFGGLVSFEVSSEQLANQIISKTKIFQLAVSLGAVESLISQPSKMTHATIPTEEQLKIGITNRLLRLSVGIEDVEDLIEDLQQAFKI